MRLEDQCYIMGESAGDGGPVTKEDIKLVDAKGDMTTLEGLVLVSVPKYNRGPNILIIGGQIY